MYRRNGALQFAGALKTISNWRLRLRLRRGWRICRGCEATIWFEPAAHSSIPRRMPVLSERPAFRAPSPSSPVFRAGQTRRPPATFGFMKSSTTAFASWRGARATASGCSPQRLASTTAHQFRLWRLHHLVRICSRDAYGSLSDEQDLRHS